MRVTDGKHRCPWPGCKVTVEAHAWGCRHHWFAIPRELRQRVWAHYRRGQTVWTASPEYLEALTAVGLWIAAHTASEASPAPVARQDSLPL